MPRPVTPDSALAVVGGRLATELVDVTSDLAALDSHGFWAVVLPFEAAPLCARFATVRPAPPWPGPPWRGQQPAEWQTPLSGHAFRHVVWPITSSHAARTLDIGTPTP